MISTFSAWPSIHENTILYCLFILILNLCFMFPDNFSRLLLGGRRKNSISAAASISCSFRKARLRKSSGNLFPVPLSQKILVCLHAKLLIIIVLLNGTSVKRCVRQSNIMLLLHLLVFILMHSLLELFKENILLCPALQCLEA